MKKVTLRVFSTCFYSFCTHNLFIFSLFIMTSKLDRHFDLIRKLRIEGSTYRGISERLTELGVEVRATSVAAFLDRRLARLGRIQAKIQKLQASSTGMQTAPANTEFQGSHVQQSAVPTVKIIPSRKSSISSKDKDSSVIDELIRETAKEPAALLKKK